MRKQQGLNPGLSPKAWHKLIVRMRNMNIKYREELYETYLKELKKVG
ncbi:MULTISPECIES: hypothetical protein [Paenibacillus]|nr:hypothetical protein [Paenibacillus odorifer]